MARHDGGRIHATRSLARTSPGDSPRHLLPLGPATAREHVFRVPRRCPGGGAPSGPRRADLAKLLPWNPNRTP